jgi:hypothetical protein
MNTALLLLQAVLAQTITSEPPALTTQAAIQKFDESCTGEKSPECDQLRWQLEYALYEDLLFLARTTGKVDDELLRIGAAADVPQLKALCLKLIFDRGLRPEEHPLVIRALNDPYPLVRAAARRMIHKLPEEHGRRLARQVDPDGSRVVAGGLIPGELPGATRLSATPYPGATYWFFASDRESDFFTTPDAPEKVLAFYAKNGKKGQTLTELKAQIEAARKAPEKDPMLLSRLMMEAVAKGEDPAKVMERLMKGFDPNYDWGKNIETREGVSSPRYLVLAETEFFAMPVPAAVVVVFKDELMGATSVVFRHPPPPFLPPMGSKKEMAAFQRRLEILSSPDAQVPLR